MAITCGIPAVRFTLIVLNLFCFLCGLSLAIVGIVMHHRLASVNSLTEKDNLLTSESLLAMSLGWFIFVVAFFGFCGAAKHSYCMTMAYALMLMALIVIQIVVAVLLFASVETGRHQYLEWFDEYFDRSLQMTKASSVVDPRIDRLQSTYGCCGMHSFRDWGTNVPDSCCSEGKGPTCVPYEQGCEQMLEGYIRQVAKIIGWILISLTVFEFVALMMACCLASDIKNQLNAFYIP
ncbi:CD63 antigen-like [Ochlerotatus camptorhynchus]|uniref:CD63 antigen-like n=1 Tax=Ochlerotatus camptorhynchus TaxID=644619 RepID=UPI0031DCE26D